MNFLMIFTLFSYLTLGISKTVVFYHFNEDFFSNIVTTYHAKYFSRFYLIAIHKIMDRIIRCAASNVSICCASTCNLSNLVQQKEPCLFNNLRTLTRFIPELSDAFSSYLNTLELKLIQRLI